MSQRCITGYMDNEKALQNIAVSVLSTLSSADEAIKCLEILKT